ncbi:MAG TPA: BamA/TamA family outer membrane protein [Pyrinomonadaceae bacterium]|nr:BamA/TamA family outer membrane protein [Pyrinomonadaceae bacterium]
MIDRSKNLLKVSLFAIALSIFGSMTTARAAQENVPTSTLAPAQSREIGSTASGQEENELGTPEAATAQSSTGSQSSGTSGLASRVKDFSRNGPRRESRTIINLGTKYFNAVFGGLGGFGFGIQATTADVFRFVEFRATALISTRLYRRFEGEAYFPEVFHKNTHADVWFDYTRRTKENLYGIGPRIPNTSQTNFDLEERSYNATLYHDFSRNLQVGGYLSVSNSATYRGKRDRDIPIDQLFSGDPATVPIANWAPGLFVNTRILSYGCFAEYDGRNNSRGLTKGTYFYGRIGSAEGLKNQNTFSDYGWLEAELDGRGYVPLGSDKTSLALRGYASLKNPKGGSQIPFYELSFLGGRMHVRGFRHFRFRGNNAALGSAELRQTVWTQSEVRGLDVFAFGDAGHVWGDNRSQTDPTILANQEFDSRNWRASVGGGLQYRYSKNFAGRIEIGHSNERNLIYVSISRGF